MNNRGQNVNPNGTPQNNHPNQGYPQQNSQYQGNGYNGQNPQNFNRNVNNQNPYQNQNSQANNLNNLQYPNGQNQPYNNMNNPQYRGQGYNAQSPQNNNMNNPQYRGQGNNGQNPQFCNPNNSQFSNQNGYNNPNQFNPQFGNNQNFNPMNRGPKMDSKMIGYITAAVAAILVVLMIFMFSSGSGKLGGATPEEAAENAISAMKDGDFKKLANNYYYESDEARTIDLDVFNSRDDGTKKSSIERAKTFSDMVEIGEVKSINENRAIVELKAKGDVALKQLGGSPGTMHAKKVNGRWFIESSLAIWI